METEKVDRKAFFLIVALTLGMAINVGFEQSIWNNEIHVLSCIVKSTFLKAIYVKYMYNHQSILLYRMLKKKIIEKRACSVLFLIHGAQTSIIRAEYNIQNERSVSALHSQIAFIRLIHFWFGYFSHILKDRNAVVHVVCPHRQQRVTRNDEWYPFEERTDDWTISVSRKLLACCRLIMKYRS